MAWLPYLLLVLSLVAGAAIGELALAVKFTLAPVLNTVSCCARCGVWDMKRKCTCCG